MIKKSLLEPVLDAQMDSPDFWKAWEDCWVTSIP